MASRLVDRRLLDETCGRGCPGSSGTGGLSPGSRGLNRLCRGCSKICQEAGSWASSLPLRRRTQADASVYAPQTAGDATV